MASGGGTTDSKQAAGYLIDPLTAPQPNAETGPGARLTLTTGGFPSPPDSPQLPRKQNTGSSTSTNPFRRSKGSTDKNGTSVSVRDSRDAYPSPPASASPQRRNFPHSSPRQEAFGSNNSSPPLPQNCHTGRRRGVSLGERYPGDRTHEPLSMLRWESKRAARPVHLKKGHLPGADVVDRLDPLHSGRFYHHEGPYDATLFARNSSVGNSPIAAVARGNQEALNATPAEKIQDAIKRHRPLDGVAAIHSGERDGLGRLLRYEEGPNLMLEPQSVDPGYKRWHAVDYHPADVKGKGEPSYSADRTLKQHKRGNGMGEGPEAVELLLSPVAVSGRSPAPLHRSSSHGKPMSEGLRDRLGSLQRQHPRA